MHLKQAGSASVRGRPRGPGCIRGGRELRACRSCCFRASRRRLHHRGSSYANRGLRRLATGSVKTQAAGSRAFLAHAFRASKSNKASVKRLNMKSGCRKHSARRSSAWRGPGDVRLLFTTDALGKLRLCCRSRRLGRRPGFAKARLPRPLAHLSACRARGILPQTPEGLGWLHFCSCRGRPAPAQAVPAASRGPRAPRAPQGGARRSVPYPLPTAP